MQMMADGQNMIAGSADSPVGPSWSRRRSERPNHSEGATDPAEPDGPGDPCFFAHDVRLSGRFRPRCV